MTDLSIIIPVYNRGELIRYTLESVRRATADLAVEVIVVDDGSTPPAAESITRLGYAPTKLIRQPNQGLLFARLAGLREATGRFTLFLDSDDLVSNEKLRAQVSALDTAGADVSYADVARTVLEGEYDQLAITADAPCATTTDSAELFITIQPPPHGPIFRTSYLRTIVDDAFIAPSARYNPIAEIWFYFNAAPRAARVVKATGPHTIIGQHPGARLTNHWEKLGVASLAALEAFAHECPDAPETAAARQLVAEKAFAAWRKLPRDFAPEFDARLLDVWRRLDRHRRLARLGGPLFQTLARAFGPVFAGRSLRRFQNGTYTECRTMSDTDLAALMATLPPA